MEPILTPGQFDILRRLDGCTLANAIETFNERLRNEGFADSSIHCLFPSLRPMLGYAATLKIRGSAPPTDAGVYTERTDWWDYILSLPSPRVVLVQDMATKHGLGSFLGPVHVNILHALGCVGAVTNGAVRGLRTAEHLGFQLFAGSVSVSHAYVHVVEFGTPVEIGGWKVHSGELIHGDLHGVQSVPAKIADRLPAAAADVVAWHQKLTTLCQSPDFSLDKLRDLIKKHQS